MRSTASFIRLILFFLIAITVIEWTYDTGEEWAMFTEPMFWVIVAVLMLLAITFEVFAASIRAVLLTSLNEEQQANFIANEKLENDGKYKWLKEKYKASLDTKTIEEEHEIILDHNYDGIKELDNNLPPWWVYMFYASIIFAVVYLVRFEILNDYNQVEEYESAVVQAKIDIANWKKTAKNLIDVNSVTVLTEPADLSTGKTIFNEKCIACHKSDGGGGIGPNLTDEYWILGGGVKNVYRTISEGGRDGKGMISWKADLKPLEIAQVASYVLSFKGTTPAEPKEAQGEIWTDEESK